MTKGPIVIVEDDKDDQEIYAEALTAIGIPNEVRFFNGGPELLDYLMTTDEQPFIILSDINMPGMSGLELLRHIKEKHHEPPPVVMMITAYGDKENYDTAMRLGADDFLAKPLEFNVLKEKLKAIH